MRKLATLFGLLMLTFSAQAQAPRSNEPIPYIYHYSQVEKAIIIERADGTDIHFIGQYIMPEDHYFVDNVTWSSSGEWMAWESSPISYGGPVKSSAWVARTDGSQTISLTSEGFSTSTLVWSPLDDLLLVRNEDNNRVSSSTDNIFVYDPNKQEIVVESTHRYGGYNGFEIPNGDWSKDGQSIYFVAGVLVRLGLDGTYEYWTEDPTQNVFHYSNNILVTSTYSVRENGGYGIDIVAMDFKTGREWILDRDDWNGIPTYQFYWNKLGTRGFATRERCENESCSTILLYLDGLNETSQLMSSRYQIAYVGNCEYICGSTWSLDGRFALTTDTNGYPVLFDSSTTSFRSIGKSILKNWMWTNSVLSLEMESGISLYDLNTYSNLQLPEDYSNVGYDLGFNISPDGQYSAPVTEDVIIDNLRTGERHEWVRHQMTTFMGPVVDIKWSDDSEWFFSGGNSQLVDSCCRPTFIILHRIGETDRRELHQCYVVSGCTGFVPDQALPHLSEATSTLTRMLPPTFILEHDKHTSDLQWSDDGTQLLVCVIDTHTNGKLVVWNYDGIWFTKSKTYSLQVPCDYHVDNALRWLTPTTIEIRALQQNEILDLVTGNQSVIDTLGTLSSGEKDGFQLLYGEQPDSSVLISIDTTRVLFTWSRSEMLPNDFSVTASDGLAAFAPSYAPVVIYDLKTNQIVHTIYKSGNGVEFSPDGILLAISGTQWVTIYNVSEQ